MSDNDPYQLDDSDDDDFLFEDPVNNAPEPPPYRDPSQRVAGGPTYVSVPCPGCGYNLTGVAIGGHCPECGATVDASLYAAGSAPANGFAITSMVLGIVSLVGVCCCGGVLAVLGLIFGSISLNQIKTGSYCIFLAWHGLGGDYL